MKQTAWIEEEELLAEGRGEAACALATTARPLSLGGRGETMG
jgi:hypothetical protein